MPQPARTRAAEGSITKLPSGNYRVRHVGPDGKRRSKTFTTKTDARVFLTTQSADVVRRTWRAPELGRQTLGELAQAYIERDDLRPSTRALYANLWRLHLAETWEGAPVGDVSAAGVRAWHDAAKRTTGATVLAQSYRLLRAVFNMAVHDELIATNPCRLRSAGTPKAARPSHALKLGEVQQLARAVPPRYEVLVYVLALAGLRFGEATALTRADVTADGSSVTVSRTVRYLEGTFHVGPPKTDAGRRMVALPPSVAALLVAHLERYVPAEGDALVFGTRNGTYLSVPSFGQMFKRAADALDLPPVRVHELRHTGATLAASTGASTAELMHRLGHATPAAALIYQHATVQRDSEIARALDALVMQAANVKDT